MLAAGGAWNGRQIVPRQWIIDSTTESNPPLAYPGRAARFGGYGNQLWLLGGGAFSLIGVHGQRVFVDPRTRLVIVQTAVFLPPTGAGLQESVQIWRALLAQEGGR